MDEATSWKPPRITLPPTASFAQNTQTTNNQFSHWNLLKFHCLLNYSSKIVNYQNSGQRIQARQNYNSVQSTTQFRVQKGRCPEIELNISQSIEANSKYSEFNAPTKTLY